jgi:hypothetical protein
MGLVTLVVRLLQSGILKTMAISLFVRHRVSDRGNL